MLKCGCLTGEARSQEQGFATGELRAMDAGGDRCIMELGTETRGGHWKHASLTLGTLGTCLPGSNCWRPQLGFMSSFSAYVKGDPSGLLIQPGCGCHSRGSAHRRHGYAGPGSAADGQEACHREEVTHRGDPG